MPYAAIRAIEHCLPAIPSSNEDLAKQFPAWTAEAMEAKTEILTRASPRKTNWLRTWPWRRRNLFANGAALRRR